MTIGSELREAVRGQQYDGAIEITRQGLDADITSIADPDLKEWLGLRWRNLFISHAASDEQALENAAEYGDFKQRMGSMVPGVSFDRRQNRERIAEAYLRGPARQEWTLDMPAPDRHAFPDDLTIVWVPGLATGLLPAREFPTIFPDLADNHGWNIIRADVNPLSSCETAAKDIARAVREGLGLSADDEVIAPDDARIPQNMVLIGYSKGTPDILQFLVDNPEFADRTRAVITWVGAARGSYLATDTYRQIKDMDLPSAAHGLSGPVEALLRIVSPGLHLKGRVLDRSGEFDFKAAVRALVPEVRQAWLDEHSDELDAMKVPILSMTASTEVTRVPSHQVQGFLALSEYDHNNDMQITQHEATLNHMRMATHLGRMHANHWDVSFEAWPREHRLTSPNLAHRFPKKAMLLALMELFQETGIVE